GLAVQVARFEVVDGLERTTRGLRVQAHRFGPTEHLVSDQELYGHRISGETLTLFPYGRRPLVLHVPEPLQDHVAQLLAPFPAHRGEGGRSALERATVAVEHDRVCLRLDPVFAPPARLAMFGLVLAAGPLVAIGLFLVVGGVIATGAWLVFVAAGLLA